MIGSDKTTRSNPMEDMLQKSVEFGIPWQGELNIVQIFKLKLLHIICIKFEMPISGKYPNKNVTILHGNLNRKK